MSANNAKIDKLETAILVGVSSQQPNQQTKQSNQKTNQKCSYSSGGHFSHECTKYKAVNARKDRVMSLKLCFNCLKPGHSSKTCCSTRTCRTCGLHHHSLLCIKAHSNSNSSVASNPSPSNSNSTVSQGKSNQSSASTSSTNNCTKYKAANARKDRVMSLKLCFNCLKPGHSSKTCCSTRTCRTCRLHHHSLLCIKAHSNSNSSVALNPSPSNSNSTVSQGKSNQSSASTSSTNKCSSKAQAQTQAKTHPNKPVVTPNKTNLSQAWSSAKTSGQSPASNTTYVTSVNSTSFPNNVLPTATLNVRYCYEQVKVRAFFDTGSHRSFISPDVVKRLNLRVIKQIPVNLSMFGNKTESCMFDLVNVKVRLGKNKIPITLLVHDSTAMGYFNCPSLFKVAKRLESKGFHLADHDIKSDVLTGIEILIGVDHLTRLIMRQK